MVFEKNIAPHNLVNKSYLKPTYSRMLFSELPWYHITFLTACCVRPTRIGSDRIGLVLFGSILRFVCLSQTCTDCGDNILSFGSIEALFEQEAKTATRQVLMGHRYMKLSAPPRCSSLYIFCCIRNTIRRVISQLCRSTHLHVLPATRRYCNPVLPEVRQVQR